MANVLASEHPFGEPSFMRTLDLDAMNVPEFPEYANEDPPMVADGELVMEMEFNSREVVIKLIRVRMMRSKYCWKVRGYNDIHTCTIAIISHGHLNLDSNTIAEAIKPLVEAGPSIKVRFVITDVQSKFNYTLIYHKEWLAMQKAVEKIDGNNNVVPIAFALVEGETSDAWFFFLRYLQTYVVTRDGARLISDRHESISSLISHL
ncbi:hypothetical protein Ahy_B04g072892 [Arachis hypogaea]|uniref:MULE transposase domain-containing protein n=1 Tax=Arachis hypogaea TaxID=3818 RepID=A0A444ZP68_ARAHY|nr:hypothetical protein Ahy_B04g072892 [Arachis hypogaea]